MSEPVSCAVSSGVIKGVNDIKLDNDAKRLLKEGIMMDSSLNLAVNEGKNGVPQKVVERENFSNYIYPPLKWRFPKFVRIIGWILVATRKFKLGMVRARLKNNLPVSDQSTPDSLSFPPQSSQSLVFSVIQNQMSHPF